MIKEEYNIDLTTLMDRFVEDGDYTKEVILEELQYHQKFADFLHLTGDNGFLIGFRVRDSLWIVQGFNAGLWKECREAINYAKAWAKARGMTSLTGTTSRRQFKAINSLGWQEERIFVKMEV